MTTTTTPRTLAALASALRSLQEFNRQLVEHDTSEPADGQSDDWQRWDETMDLIIRQERDAKSRLTKLLTEVSTAPFAMVIGAAPRGARSGKRRRSEH